jgi:hypothetical protein
MAPGFAGATRQQVGADRQYRQGDQHSERKSDGRKRREFEWAGHDKGL